VTNRRVKFRLAIAKYLFWVPDMVPDMVPEEDRGRKGHSELRIGIEEESVLLLFLCSLSHQKNGRSRVELPL